MDPADVPAETDDQDSRDDIPDYLLDSGPARSQFGLKALFWFTTVCGGYFAVERFSGGRAAAIIFGFGLPLVWLSLFGLTIADRVMSWPMPIVLAILIGGLVAFGAFLAYRV